MTSSAILAIDENPKAHHGDAHAQVFEKPRLQFRGLQRVEPQSLERKIRFQFSGTDSQPFGDFASQVGRDGGWPLLLRQGVGDPPMRREGEAEAERGSGGRVEHVRDEGRGKNSGSALPTLSSWGGHTTVCTSPPRPDAPECDPASGAIDFMPPIAPGPRSPSWRMKPTSRQRPQLIAEAGCPRARR